jgi:hypothetical protein
MSYRRSWLAILAVFCLMAPPTWAQAQHALPAAPPPAPPTLAWAMGQAKTSQDTLYVAVTAEKVDPPPGLMPSISGDSVRQVAVAYGQIVQDFGDVTAVAPPTMTVLNMDPGDPDPYDGLPPSDALKLLAGSLSDSQWALLTGTQGLGYDDLIDMRQQELFRAQFPGGSLHVQQDMSGGGTSLPDITLTANDLRAARLRLCQQVSLSLPNVGQPHSYSGMGTEPDGKPHYTAFYNIGTTDTVYGAQLRAVVPNTPKPSDLSEDSLNATIPLAGIKTVGDLIGRIGVTAHLELYADPRYASRLVILAGPMSARAGDLLQALALCVRGTYRHVGPAYVLTDDLMGLGTRQMILSRFAQQADEARAGAMGDAGDHLYARGGLMALPAADPGLSVTPAEMAQDPNAANAPPGFQMAVEIPFAQMTTTQQALARKELQQFQQQESASPNNPTWQVSLNGTIMLQAQPMLQLLTPAVPCPVSLNLNTFGGQLFQPSAKLAAQIQAQQDAKQQARWQAQEAQKPKTTLSPAPPKTASPLLPRRAVLAHPRTAQEVVALVASMRRLGLNQLWLDVFSEGKSHLDGKPDILTEALAKTRGTGIVVVPTLNVLTWNTDAPKAAQDLTVLGENSAQAADAENRYSAIVSQGKTPDQADAQPPTATLSVWPAAPTVVATLTALVQRLAATPGVGVIALQGTTTDSYNHDPDQNYGGSGTDLGYTLSLRLTYLRRTHVDPIDLSIGVSDPVGQMASVPDFESEMGADAQQAMQSVNGQWNAVRAAADVSLMRQLLAAAQAGAGHLMPLLVRQRGVSGFNGDWWGLWASPNAPLPSLTTKAQQAGFMNPSNNGYATFAHSQCPVDIYHISLWGASSSSNFSSAVSQLTPGWDGFVLDLDDGNANTSGNPLAALTPNSP